MELGIQRSSFELFYDAARETFFLLFILEARVCEQILFALNFLIHCKTFAIHAFDRFTHSMTDDKHEKA